MSTSSSQIHLDPTEQTFLQHLDRFSRKQVPPVECRIAGGWVRDKLLSLPSSDLDVALTIPSGYSFATEFVDYLKGEGVSTGSVGKVAVNPEQSKHLETGTTRILGLECDFVGLRSETYADSRIPDQVRLGTPLEDALRRDLTINALFYNVHTKEIEDHTGHGISDLRNRVARTPLAPRQTFQDDPLRIIRTVRFASRFDLSIQKDVADAIMDPEVKIALQTKVSRERFGIEVTKMMQKSPYRALQLITSLGLHSSIFVAPVDPPRRDVMQVCDILRTVVQHFEDDYILWYTAATCPFRDMVIHSKKDIPAASLVLGEGLKTGNDIRDSVTKLLAVPRYIDTSASKRSDIGLMLKNSSVRPWKRSIAWCAVMSILPIWSGTWDHGAQALLDRYLAFVAMVHDVGLATDIERPALLNGNEIKQLLELKPGPVLSVIGEAVTVWQLDHPEGTKEDCAQWLSDQWAGEGRVAWEESVAKGSKRKR